ncbi:MAG: flagellar export chaperone FlgN [Gemmatimonadetes bacterium]|nr:flagellar export chaperone FlgN [Gemmatimonadota bacterium]MBI3568676.1 flagellar export chaperone FlgN [Gemmatimonadota bacterium]
MTHLPAVAEPVQVRTPIAHTTGTVSALGDALRSEARLLADLVAIMRRQRDAVSRDDLDAIDDSVFATHRVLVTLGEARRRRRSLNHLLGEGDDLSLAAIEDFFVGDVPADLQAAVALVTDGARALQREVEINRRVLRHAIDAADQFVRSLYGGPVAPATGYPSPAVAGTSTTYAPRTGGVILDRRV